MYFHVVCFSWFLLKNHSIGLSIDSKKDWMVSNKIMGFDFSIYYVHSFLDQC